MRCNNALALGAYRCFKVHKKCRTHRERVKEEMNDGPEEPQEAQWHIAHWLKLGYRRAMGVQTNNMRPHSKVGKKVRARGLQEER